MKNLEGVNAKIGIKSHANCHQISKTMLIVIRLVKNTLYLPSFSRLSSIAVNNSVTFQKGEHKGEFWPLDAYTIHSIYIEHVHVYFRL